MLKGIYLERVSINHHGIICQEWHWLAKVLTFLRVPSYRCRVGSKFGYVRFTFGK